jgi:hypothetical protein
LPALSGQLPQTADSASGGSFRQIPLLPVTPAVVPSVLSIK